MRVKISSLVVLLFFTLFTVPSYSAIVKLYDGNRCLYDIDTQIGAEIDGYRDAYDLFFLLYVDGTTYNPDGNYTLGDNGRSVILPSMIISGLNVSRKIFVPANNGKFARFLNIFTNPTPDPITVDITIGGNLGSNGTTLITDSSDNDNLAEVTDTWIAIDDGYDGGADPSLGFVLQGDGAGETLDSITKSFSATPFNYFYGSSVFPANGIIWNDSFFYTFSNVTVNPYETAIIMIFGIQASNNADAIAETISLVSLPAIALTGLTDTERSQIINFDVGPSGTTTTTTTATTTSTTTTTDPPTLIEMSYFTAESRGVKVLLKWRTESEINNMGFNILRSEKADGEYVQINKELIPAKGGATQERGYKFIDKKAVAGKTYYYVVEDIDRNGVSTIHGPKEVKVSYKKKRK